MGVYFYGKRKVNKRKTKCRGTDFIRAVIGWAVALNRGFAPVPPVDSSLPGCFVFASRCSSLISVLIRTYPYQEYIERKQAAYCCR